MTAFARRNEARCLQILDGEKTGQKPLGRRKRKWEDNTKMYLEGMGWDGVDHLV